MSIMKTYGTERIDTSDTEVSRIFAGALTLLSVLGLLAVGAGLGLILAHAAGELNERHLTSDQKGDALDGVYTVDRIELADNREGPLQFQSPVQFLEAGGALFSDGDSNRTLELTTSETIIIDEIVTRSIELPPLFENSTTIETLIEELIVFCETQSVTVLETLLQQITTFIEGFGTKVDGYETRFEMYYMDYVTRNSTFWSNEDRINTFNVTCNGTQVASVITLFNATESRLQLLIDAHQVNMFNYTTQLARYDNISTLVGTQLAANCSGLLNLETTLLQLQIDYNATVVTLNTTTNACDNCAAALVNATARFDTLVSYETALNGSLNTLLTETADLGANTTALETAATNTLMLAQNVTATGTQLVQDYDVLNASAAALQSNITSLRDLALVLQSNYSQLETDVSQLDVLITNTLNLVQHTVANCTLTNETLISQLLADFELLTQNISATRTLVLGTLANTTRLDNLNDLQQRLAIIESDIIALDLDYTNALAQFTALNASFVALEMQYTSLLASFGLLETDYVSVLATFTTLQSLFNTLNGTYNAINTTITVNAENITQHELRIATLEPDLGCNITSIDGATPAMVFQAIANQNMSRGTPVSLRPDAAGVVVGNQRVAPARGVRFEDSLSVGSTTSISSGLLDPTFGQTTLDNADFLYTIFDSREPSIINNITTGKRGGVVKLSPSKEAVWYAAAQTNNFDSVNFVDIEYNAFTDTIWLRSQSLGTNADGLFLFDADDYDTPSFFSPISDPGSTIVLLELSRSGKWLHAEIISGVQGFAGERYASISINSHGVLCGGFMVQTNNQVTFANGSSIAISAASVPDATWYHAIYCYDTTTKLLISADLLTSESFEYRPSSSPVVVFDAGGILLAMYHFGRSGNVSFTLTNGFVTQTTGQPGQLNGLGEPTQPGGNLHYIVSRIEPTSCRPVWVKQFLCLNGGCFFSRDIRLDLFAMQQQGVIILKILGDTNTSLAYDTPGNVLGQSTAHFIVAFSKVDGSFINAHRFPSSATSAFRRSGTFYYDARMDALHCVDEFTVMALATGIGIAYQNETFSFGFPTASVGAFLRFDGSIDRLGHLTFFNRAFDDAPYTFYFAIAVNSHGTIYMLSGDNFYGPFETFATYQDIDGLGQLLEAVPRTVTVPGTAVYSLTTFSQEDFWPIGVLRADAVKGEVVDVVMRGSTTIGGNFFSADDVGGVFHVDVVNGGTMARTRVGDRSQVGIKTSAADEFLVDIHTTPLIGSDQ